MYLIDNYHCEGKKKKSIFKTKRFYFFITKFLLKCITRGNCECEQKLFFLINSTNYYYYN